MSTQLIMSNDFTSELCAPLDFVSLSKCFVEVTVNKKELLTDKRIVARKKYFLGPSLCWSALQRAQCALQHQR